MPDETVLRDFLSWIAKQNNERRDCGVGYGCLSYEIDRYLKEKASRAQ